MLRVWIDFSPPPLPPSFLSYKYSLEYLFCILFFNFFNFFSSTIPTPLHLFRFFHLFHLFQHPSLYIHAIIRYSSSTEILYYCIFLLVLIPLYMSISINTSSLQNKRAGLLGCDTVFLYYRILFYKLKWCRCVGVFFNSKICIFNQHNIWRTKIVHRHMYISTIMFFGQFIIRLPL